MGIILPIAQDISSASAKHFHIHPADIIKDIKPADIKGIRILFINMPLRETAVPSVTPEGPLLMATNLIQNYGVDATILDLNAYRIKDELAEKRGLPTGRHLTHQEARRKIHRHILKHGTPDVIGLSGMITTLKWQEAIAKIIRLLLPDVFLVSGNGLATELKMGLFNYIPELNAVAHSEGDDVIVKICYDVKMIKNMGFNNALNAGKLNPYYLGHINGQHRFMYAGDRPRDLDILPFADLELIKEDFDGVPVLNTYLDNAIWGASANNSSAAPFTMTRSTSSVSSRGCPYGCKYCYRGSQGERDWGTRSAQHLYKEVAHHVERYGIDFKGYPDDNFAVTVKRIKDLVPLFKDLGIHWGTHTRLDEAAGLVPATGSGGKEFGFENPLRVKLMAEAGCVYIGFGPESANPKVLEALGKGGFTLKAGFEPTRINGQTYQFAKAMKYGIKHAEEAGVHSNCTWIIGSPTETLEDVKDTVAFIMWQEEFYKQFNIPSEAVNKRMFTLTWYPGTEMIKHPKVHTELSRVFGLKFDPITFEPVCDENFHNYCLELDDATKVLHDPNTGEPLNFGDMPTEQFLEAREYIDSDHTFKIMDM